MKRIYCYDPEGNCTEAFPVAPSLDFQSARIWAASAADEIIHNGRDADTELVFRSLEKCVGHLLPEYLPRDVCEIEHELENAYVYLRAARANDAYIVWQYILDRLLDFLEAEHFTKEA